MIDRPVARNASLRTDSRLGWCVQINRVLRQLQKEKLHVFRSSLVEISDLAKSPEQRQFNPACLYIDLYLADTHFSLQRQQPRETFRISRRGAITRGEDGLVVLDEPHGIAITMTVDDTPRQTGQSLISAAGTAARQIVAMSDDL